MAEADVATCLERLDAAKTAPAAATHASLTHLLRIDLLARQTTDESGDEPLLKVQGQRQRHSWRARRRASSAPPLLMCPSPSTTDVRRLTCFSSRARAWPSWTLLLALH